MSLYPNQGSDYVLLPLIFRVVKKATSYNTEQHCGFRSSLPPEELHITPSLGTTGIERITTTGKIFWSYFSGQPSQSLSLGLRFRMANTLHHQLTSPSH